MKYRGLVAEAVRLFEEGRGSKSVASFLGVHKSTARSWEHAYRALGKEALLNGKNLSYSRELKLEAVRMFLDEGVSKPRIMEVNLPRFR